MVAVLEQSQGTLQVQTPRTMSVLWSPAAFADLAALRAYIAEDNPAAADEIVLRIFHNIEQLLSRNPSMGRPGRVPGTRELVVPRTPYIVPYRIKAGDIEVLRVYHGARRWPDRF